MIRSRHSVGILRPPTIAVVVRRTSGRLQRSALTLAAAILAGALVHMPACAQTADDPGPSPASEPGSAPAPYLLDDLKAFAAEPLRWQRREWLRFAGVAAAVSVAYQYDDDVRAHYANDGEANYHEVADAMPPAIVFGATWFAAKLGHNEEASREAAMMRRAFVLQTISTEVIKVAFRRGRPGPGVPRDHWNDGDLSFPSGHTASAFAIGTVLAESGDDEHRLLRRVIGYGIGVAVGYQRLNHDAHWFSDTVAGAALGIATAKFVMKRHEGTEPRGVFALQPMEGGVMMTYAVPLR
jgi:membrane-associated phospholipid phosphatase